MTERSDALSPDENATQLDHDPMLDFPMPKSVDIQKYVEQGYVLGYTHAINGQKPWTQLKDQLPEAAWEEERRQLQELADNARESMDTLKKERDLVLKELDEARAGWTMEFRGRNIVERQRDAAIQRAEQLEVLTLALYTALRQQAPKKGTSRQDMRLNALAAYEAWKKTDDHNA